VYNRLVLFFIILAATLFTVSCSSGTTTKTQQSPIVFTSPANGSAALDQGQSINITVSVVGGSAVNWSLQPAYGTPKGTPVGSLSSTTGTSVTYNACAVGAGCQSTQQLTIVATAGTNSAVLAVTVNSLPAIQASSPFPACPPAGQAPVGSVLQVGKYFTTNTGSGTATITVSGGVAPYTWSIASGALPAGMALGLSTTLSTVGAAISGTPSGQGCVQSGVTLQVTDATGATGTSSPIFYAVVPPSLSMKLPDYSGSILGVSYEPTALEVGSGIPPYTWCISTNPPLPPGLFTSPSTPNPGNFVQCSSPQTSSTLVIYGTASGEVFSYTPTLTVTDTEFPYPAIGTVNLTMNALGSSTCDPTAASNPVAYLEPGVHPFQVKGFDGSGNPVVIEGSLVTQNVVNSGNYQGTITGGSEDIINASGAQTGLTITSGSYFNANGHGCLSFTNSAGTTSTFAFALSGCSLGATSANCNTLVEPNDPSTVCGQQDLGGVTTYYLCLPVGRIIEFDDADGTGTVATGILRTADTSSFSSGPSGTYAFGLSGWDSSGGRYAAAGSFGSSSTTLTSVAADINDAGSAQTALTGGSGTFSSVNSTTGRATASLSVGTASLNLVAYMVGSNEILWSTAGGAGSPIVSGEAIVTNGPFSAASLQNSHIFHTAGLSGSSPDVSIGLFSFDGVGNVSGTVYEDQGGTPGTTAASGVYTVDPNTGRVLFAATQSGQTLGAHPLVGYVIPVSNTLTRSACVNPASCVTGFLVGTTDATAQAGELEFQTPYLPPPPPFNNTYLAGFYAFGSDELLDDATAAREGEATATPSATGTTSGAFGLIQDSSHPNLNYCVYAGLSQTCSMLITSDLLGGGSSYTLSTSGTGTVDGESVSVTNGNVIFYINESPLNLHPAVIVAQQ
jgi:hypothetical protein